MGARSYQVAVIPGDGIGQEVIPQALRVLEWLAARDGFQLACTAFPYSCRYYLEHGHMLPEQAFSELRGYRAILLGAIGDPRLLPDHLSLRGLLVPLRQRFDLYVNLRPVKALRGLPGPLKGDPPFDMVFVRENSEGEYAGMGGRIHQGGPHEVAVQTSLFSRHGVERVLRYAFELASRRSGRLASATKSNAMQHAFVFWDEVAEELCPAYPGVELRRYHADALAAALVQDPLRFDVVVASNLLGDVLTDLAGALMGSLGIPASANLNPEGGAPPLFEPVHGSAPDIAGLGVANPLAAFWSASLLLDHLGESRAAADLLAAVEALVASGRVLTPDLGGQASTSQVTDALLAQLEVGA